MWRILFSLYAYPLLLMELSLLTRDGRGLSGWMLVNFFIYPALLVVSIALHEGGHALAARAVGLRVPRVDVGVGRRVLQRRWGRTLIALHAFPTVGFTHLGGERLEGLRWRLWLAVAAGPLVTAGLMAALMAWPTPLSLTATMLPLKAFATSFALRETLAFTQFWLLAFNLVPLPFFRSLGLMNNDGAQLLMLPFRREARLRDMLVMPALLEAQELTDAGNLAGAQRILDEALGRAPGSWVVRNSVGILQLARREWEAGRATFRALVDEEPPSPDHRWIARNNLAWADFCLRRAELRDEANEHSAAVFERFRSVGWALGTRGAVLTWLGRHEEAIRLLEQAYVRNSNPGARAINACCLVLAHAALSHPGEARKWLERAQANHPGCFLLGEARTAAGVPEKVPHLTVVG